MKIRILSAALMFVGIVISYAAATSELAAASIVAATGGVLLAAGLLCLATSFRQNRGTAAALRLDWFLPFLRKPKKGTALPASPLVLQVARRLLPGRLLPRRLFADRQTGKPGLFRKTLKRIGPTMLSSPLRRLVQAGCFLLFLLLFFYVCWPYTARPAAPANKSAGWRFVEIEQQDGRFRFARDTGPEWPFPAGSIVFVGRDASQETPTVPDRITAVPFILASAASPESGGVLHLEPATELGPDQLDEFLIGGGTWAIHDRQPGRWPSHYADDLAGKEFVPAELFLIIDPLVSLSTAIAARSWVWSLTSAAVILIVCVLIPRGFCGYLCPLGTLIDLFDWSVARRVKRFRLPADGWWVHIKYYLLAGTLFCAVFGVLVSGYVAAIPVITRGLLFVGEPLQTGLLRGWHLVPPMHAGHLVSIGLFLAVLCLGFLQPRFWCKYVCPSGAVFSLGNLFRVTERKVESTCINCNKCVEICPFDAIKPDFTTRVTDCTLCQTCGGVCPTHAIKFVERWNMVELKVANDPPTGETALGRRGFLSLAAGTAAACVGGTVMTAATKSAGAKLADPNGFRPVRPPGSVPEREFLQMCIRCGECFKACPNNVLQAEGFQQGLEGLWTPLVNADWAGCESSCNACGQVCPTGAIRALPLAEKKVARMGLAIVNEQTCLPFADREACQLCVDECHAAGYHAIEFMQVHTRVDEQGRPLADTGYLAPIVLPDKCVGCGLCQTRCYGINVKTKGLLTKSAIIIEAGEGKEDRLMAGSYIELRQAEAASRRDQQPSVDSGDTFFVPETVESPNDPFGLTPPDAPSAESAPINIPSDTTPADPFGINDGG